MKRRDRESINIERVYIIKKERARAREACVKERERENCACVFVREKQDKGEMCEIDSHICSADALILSRYPPAK